MTSRLILKFFNNSAMSTDVEGGGDRNPGAGCKNSLSSYPYSHRVFVGNLPRRCVESNLKDIFSKFGNVVNVRIDYNGLARYGLVIFEDEKSVADCLSQKPIYLPDGHRLNVETKKKNVSYMNFLFSPILDIGPDHVQFTFSFLLCAKNTFFLKANCT